MGRVLPLASRCTEKSRITSEDWWQTTLAVKLEVDVPSTSSPSEELTRPPYLAGDVLSLLPCNPQATVLRLIGILPPSLLEKLGPLREHQVITINEDSSISPILPPSHRWPSPTTLWSLLTYCADLTYTGCSISTLVMVSSCCYYCCCCCSSSSSSSSSSGSSLVDGASETSSASSYPGLANNVRIFVRSSSV